MTSIKLEISLTVASDTTIVGVDDLGMSYMRYGEKVFHTPWDDVSLYLIDFIEFYREVYKIDKNFADMKIAPLYHKSLLREGFTEKQVYLISSEAYDRGHHAGQDEVISYMREIALFSKDLIEAGKK